MNFRMNELTGAVARAQLRKLDRITATLRAKKQRLKELIGELHGCRYRRLNDPQGECGTLCTVIFDSAAQAAAVAAALGTTTVAESGWHVLANMDHVNRHLQQAGVPCGPGAYPRTDDLLRRSINLSVGVIDAGLGAAFGIYINSSDAEIEAAAARFRAACRESRRSAGKGRPVVAQRNERLDWTAAEERHRRVFKVEKETLNMPGGTKVRIGLIGAGWIGAHHGHNVLRNPHAELVAVADADRQKAGRLPAAQGGRGDGSTATTRNLLRQDDVDAVVIASPNAMHAEQAVAAADAAKHIYLEKPMAIALDDCRRMVKAIAKAGVKCAMGYHRRLNPLAQYARKLQEQGQLGEIALAESDYLHHVPGDLDIWQWLGKEAIAGSLLHAAAGHNIDLLRYFCGEVVEVGCFKDARMPRKIQVETEDLAVVILRFANGALGRVAMLVGPIVPFTFTLRLFGTRGTVDNNRVWLDTIPAFCRDRPRARFHRAAAMLDGRQRPGRRRRDLGQVHGRFHRRRSPGPPAAQRRGERFSHRRRLFRRRAIGAREEDRRARGACNRCFLAGEAFMPADQDYHLINLRFGAHELRRLGELELKYLGEVMQGETLSNYISEESLTRRFEEAFAGKVGVEEGHGQEQRHVGPVRGGERFRRGPRIRSDLRSHRPLRRAGGAVLQRRAALRRRPPRHLQHGPRFAAGQHHAADPGGDRDAPLGPERGDRHHRGDLPRQGHLPHRGLRPRRRRPLERQARGQLRRPGRVQLPGVQATLHRRRRHDAPPTAWNSSTSSAASGGSPANRPSSSTATIA